MGQRLPRGVLCFLIVGALIATLLAIAPGASAQTDVPDAPTDVAVYPYQSHELEVRWSSTDAASTASFKVQWKSGSEEFDSTRQVTSDATASEVSIQSTSAKSRYKETITDLTNDTEYTVRVIAVNSSGDSVPSVEETGTPKSGLPPARPFIEKEIIELFESSHPWLRKTWDFMLNQNVDAVFSSQDGGYAWIDHCSLIVAQLRRCVAKEIGAGRYYSRLEYVIVHELAHIYTLANSITSSPGPLGAAHLYFYDLVPFSYGLQHFSESEYFSCRPIELYADALSIGTLGTGVVSPGTYWRSCDYITETVSAEALSVVRSAARGDMPSWLADTYENADGNLDLDQIWAEVKAIPDTKDRAVVVYHLRNSFGGYCNNRKADASAFGNGITRNPWGDGGCQPLEPTNVTVTSTGSGTLTVSWREPSYDGGSPVEGYKIQWKSGVQEYSPSRSATVTDLADLQHTISGLASGQSHTLRVLAYNHNGDGAAAEATATPTATDTAAPTLLTARIDREDSSLRLTYSEFLDGTSVPASGAFALNIGGGSRTVTAGVAANVVTLSFSGTLNATDTVNVTYTAPTGPAARPLKDFAGNEAAGFSSLTVRNDATDVAITSDPGADKTYSWNRGGSRRDVIQATVTFNEPVSVSGVPRLRLKIGEKTRVATYASGSGTSALTFRYGLIEGDVDEDGISVQQSAIQGMVRYVSTGEEAPARVKLDPQAGHLVDAVPPSLVSAAILEGHTDLVLTWDDTLDESFVPTASSSGFYVFDKIARERVHNDAVAIQGNQVTVTLASAVTADDDLTVSYRDFVSTGLRDTVGNYAKRVSAKQVKIVQPNRVPAFPSTEDGIRAVDENTPPGRDIGAPIAATDTDGDSLTYSISGTDAASFDVVDTSGQLQTKEALNYEGKSSYTLTMSVTDGKDLHGNADTTVDDTINVRVTVSDSNEPPEITGQASHSVDENDEDFSQTYTASDPEGAASTFTWSLSGTDSGDFNLDRNTGELTFKNTPNFESPADSNRDNEYLVTVRATDEGNLRGELAVTVTVNDVNEAPTISGDDTLSFAENTATTRTLDRYTATDPEGSPLTWAVGGTDGGDFNIDTSGNLTFDQVPDHENPADSNSDNVYNVQVVATDDGNLADGTASLQGIRSATFDVAVTVTPVNEPPTVSGPASPSVNENVEDFSQTYTASDPEGDSTTFTWSLSGTDSGDFNIDRNTGELTFRSTPNYERAADSNRDNEYLFNVRAYDGQYYGTLPITVEVLNVNEPPALRRVSNPQFSRRENDTGTVYTFSATDPEGHGINWSTAGPDAADFTITGGALKFATPPDYENPGDAGRDNVYNVTVRATDDVPNQPLTDELPVTVTVTAVNEGPEISRVGNLFGTPPGSVPENQAQDTVLARYTATDPEGGMVSRWRTTGTDGGDFVINEQGELRFRNSPDYERPADSNRDNEYTFTVQVSDGSIYSSFDETVTVTPVNEPPAITTTSSSATALRQSENRTTRLYTYRATDPEGSSTIAWSLGGDDSRFFTINERGEFSFREDRAPDFDLPGDSGSDNIYEVTIQVSDDSSPPNTASLAVTVTVTDVNEGPEVTGGGDSFNVQENQEWGGATFSARDPENGDVTRWSLGGRDGSDFTIDASGVMTFRRTPDHERPDDWNRDNEYEVEIRPYDGRYYGSHAVTVTVEDVTEITGNAAITRAESQDTVLATYTAGGRGDLAVDPSWRLTGADAGDFLIDENGQLTFRNTPDHERPADSNRDNEYLFTVQALDDRYYDTFDVMVTVTPVNEPPTITTTSTSATAMRHAENRTSRLYTYRATDPEGTEIVWSLGGVDARFFAINERGELYFSETSPPDFETRRTPGQTENFVVYNLTVRAGDGTFESTLDVAITITDVNEGPEVSGTSSFTISENRNLTNAVYTATDPEGLNVARWSVGGRDGGDFFITQGGTLYFRTPPDFERPADWNRDNVYEVSIQPSDGRNNGSYPVTVEVTNINEPPEIRRGSRTAFTQPENRASRLYTFTATDPEGSAIAWLVAGADASHFTIDDRGQFSFREDNPPDFDSPGDQGGDNVYSVAVQARDTESNVSGLAVTVTVTAVNEGPTIRLQETAPGSVPENTETTRVLATYTAADPERPGVRITRWSTSGRDGGDFVINALGQLMFRYPPDYERPADANRDNFYELTIRASDGRYTGTLEEVQVFTVTDVNEMPPITTTGRTEFTQQENRTSILYTFRATDPEQDTITWSAAGPDGSHFTIDDGGRLSFTTEPDFDLPGDANQDNVYNVTIQAKDPTLNTAELEILVTVTDHNEGVEPTISTRRPPATYRENGTSTVYTFRASDPQRDSAITWSLSGTDSGAFTITPDGSGRGALAFNSPPDFESPADSNRDNEYELTVVARDPEGNSDQVSFTITVTDDNEGVEPTISTRRPPATYRENDTRIVYTFRASDPQRDPITWSLEGADTGDFSITRDSSGRGALTFISPPDYESPADANSDNEYELTVVASDGDGNSDRVTFTITVTDLNEGPVISLEGVAAASVPENTADTFVLADYTARDPENTAARIFRWSTTGRDAGDFVISELGELRFRFSPDYERPADSDRDNVYEVLVRAYDGRAYATLETPLEITVTEVNEAPVITTRSRTEFTQRENSTSSLYTYRANDQDNDDVIRWSVEGTDGEDFAIFNGILGFRLLPDFEVPLDEDGDNSYEITVVAADNRGLRDSVNAVITITDQPEGPLIAGNTSYAFAENYDIARPLGSYTATDAKDGRAVHPRWSLSGRDGGDFIIDQVTGALFFRNTPDYDRPADSDRDNTYELVVRGHDSRAYGNLAVTVTVTGINEHSPVVTGRATLSFREGTSAETRLYTYRATDEDLNAEFAWSVDGTDADDFVIDEGVLTFSRPPDFEQPGDSNTDNMYEITVVASDGTNRGILGVTVAVTELNEGPEVSGPTSFIVNENQDLANATYTARDPEATLGVSTTISWHVSGRDGGDFNIDRETGVLAFRNLPDYERPADSNRDNIYELTVRAYDGRVYGDYDVTVTVNDVSEISGPSTLTRDENFAEILATYTPAELGALPVEPSWRLLGRDSGDFTINRETGELTFRSIPNYERPADSNRDNVYEFTVQVSDATFYATLDVTVTVNAVNEGPEISGRDSLSFRENTPTTTSLHTYTARDPEEEDFTWRLDGLDASQFTISEDSQGRGVLTFAVSPNFDLPGGSGTDGNEYLVTIQARDSQGNTGELQVAVTVTDQNEGATVSGLQAISVSENRDHTLTLATYSASDPENQPISRWSLSGRDAGDFLISENGELTFRNTPDFDRPADSNRDNVYEVTVRAYDGGSYGNLDVVITVTNINEHDPVIRTGSRTAHTYREEGTSAIYNYSATDQDKDDVITWSVGGTDGGRFRFNDRNGLEFNDPPDYETPGDSGQDNVYSLTVIATDSGGRSASLTDVTVTVTALEEGPEVMGATTYSVVEGGTLSGATYTGRDPETPAADVTGWRLAGADAGDFTITGAGTQSAELAFRNPPDYDSPADSNRDNEYLVAVRAYNGSAYGSLDVTVTVTDTNEASPVVTGSQALRFNENTATATRLYTYRATDMDRNTEIGWSVRGADGNAFTISKDTSGRGELYFRTNPDYEQPSDSGGDNEYDLTIVASDGSNEGTLEVSVTVTDVNEGPEVSGQDSRSVSENFDRVLATYTSADPEGSTVIRWNLGGSDIGDFTITDTSQDGGPYTAELHFRNPPDYDRPADSNRDNQYLVSVRPYDGRVYGSYEVTITVTSDNEPPVITGRETLSFRENTLTTSQLYTYRATDPEGDSFTWSVGGEDAGRFDISETGVLTFKTSPDFEDPPRADDNDYQVTVRATDGNSNIGAFDVIVTVTDVNEGPEVTSGGDSFTVRENQDWAGATFAAADPEGSEITRWALGGRDGGDFTISDLGVLTFRNTPDHERPDDSDRDNVYEVQVRPYDGRYYGSHDVTVTVENANEITGAATFTPAENFEGILATFTAAGTGDLTVEPSWRLTGTDSGDFIISEDGELTFRNVPDHERPADSNRDNEYLFTVGVSSGRYYDTFEVTVTVASVDEAPELRSGSTTEFAYQENDTANLYTYRATDPEGDDVTWSLSGGDAGAFTISGAGALSFQVPPDYEAPGDLNEDNVYQATVEASDGEGNVRQLEVTVTVTNLTD